MEHSSLEKLKVIKERIQQIYRWEEKTLEQIRREEAIRVAAMVLPLDHLTEKTTVANMLAEWVTAENVPSTQKSIILYFHGGGFITGSCDTHRSLAAKISKAAEARVLVIEYRLAPEHKYPAANDDCLAAYRWLINSGIPAQEIVIGGDSAGGGLVLMTLLSLRDAGEPLPKAAFLLSPLTDLLYLDGESYTTRAELDPLGSLRTSQICAENYLEAEKTQPAILAPVRQNMAGLPSLLIQVGDHEVLLSDSTRLAERAKAAGVDVTLEIWDNMWHVFQMFASILPEGEQAIDHIGQFVKKHIG